MSANDESQLRKLELNDRDLQSELWLKLQPFLQARLAMLRRKNDTDLSPEQTAALRGRIAELKNLLAAGESRD